MTIILSQYQFSQALQQMCGCKQEAVKELLPFYDEAARAAKLALPRLPKLGFFSSQDEKVTAFISTCVFLDKQLEKGEITPDGTQVALLLMMVSDKGFHKATKAFAHHAYQFRNTDMTSNSDTLMMWFNSGISNR